MKRATVRFHFCGASLIEWFHLLGSGGDLVLESGIHGSNAVPPSCDLVPSITVWSGVFPPAEVFLFV